MSLYQQLVQAVEEARGEAAQAQDEEQAWAGRLAEQLAQYLNAPQDSVHYISPDEGRVMLHAGFPRLQQADGWHAFDLEIGTDLQQRHRYQLRLLFQKAPSDDDPENTEQHRARLGPGGKTFVLPSQREEFFDHLFASMLADLQTAEGRATAQHGGIRRLG